MVVLSLVWVELMVLAEVVLVVKLVKGGGPQGLGLWAVTTLDRGQPCVCVSVVMGWWAVHLASRRAVALRNNIFTAWVSWMARG